DSHSIENNPAIRSLSNAPRFFTDATTFSVLPQNQTYRPLLSVTYAVNAELFGVRAGPFVALNLILHALCAVGVMLALKKVRPLIGLEAEGAVDWVAVLAAALFAVHPLFSECVSYVSARSESLSSGLTLAALLMYLRGREAAARSSEARWVGGAAALMFAAVTTKLVVAPFLLPLLAIELSAAQRQPWTRVAARLGAVGLSVVAASALALAMTPAFVKASVSSLTPLVYLRSELPAYFHYLRLFVLPYGQSADPSFPSSASWLEARVLFSGAALAAVVGLSAYGLIRRRKVGLALAATWFLSMLAATSSIAPLAELVNEHRPYLAGAALCALLAEAVVRGLPGLLGLRAREEAAVLGAVAAALVAGYAAVTVVRNPVWRSEESLWRDVVAKGPESPRAQMNYGRALMQRGAYTEAEPYLREAVRLAPSYSYAHINLGVLLLEKGDSRTAVFELDQAVAVGGDLFWAHYYRGIAGEKLGEPPAANEARFARAVALSPAFADGQYHLALARDAVGDLPGSLAAARQAATLRGNFDDRFMFAYQLLRAGDAAAASPILARLATERPDNEKVKVNIQVARRMLGGG
ncbi:MAG: tetratricopeptide repeat protein, partial [Myxococcaceae bacterium]